MHDVSSEALEQDPILSHNLSLLMRGSEGEDGVYVSYGPGWDHVIIRTPQWDSRLDVEHLKSRILTPEIIRKEYPNLAFMFDGKPNSLQNQDACNEEVPEKRPLPQKGELSCKQTFNKCSSSGTTLSTANTIKGTYEIKGQEYNVSEKVANALLIAHKRTGMPIDAMIITASHESSIDPDAISPKTGALGLFQFMPGYPYPLFEAVYKYGAKNGYADLAKLVTPSQDPKKPGYFPINEAARDKILAEALDPTFNATMFAAARMPEIHEFEALIKHQREIKPGEIAGINNMGAAGFLKFLRKAWSDDRALQDNPDHKEMLAVDFFKANAKLYGHNFAKCNPKFIRNEKGLYKTVREALFDLNDESTIQKLDGIEKGKDNAFVPTVENTLPGVPV